MTGVTALVDRGLAAWLLGCLARNINQGCNPSIPWTMPSTILGILACCQSCRIKHCLLILKNFVTQGKFWN
ncbi:hypothetical protein EDB81DRAFT_821196 [Dactylonectria macrodidyma]|uniref:Secreted protein n=1 Tax=Dactylonectria macrodidyma TaxID=307937 RepID=A0A9P9ICU9_9HYPO|nr:hypothetical protein EDB81DRAFT_821196 [Dactylonectria macrodidyma]